MLEKDFMKIVLKRLDKIDNKLDEHSKEFKKITKQHSADIAELKKITKQNSTDIAELKKITKQNSTDIAELKEITKQNSADIAELKKITKQNSADITELKKITKQNSADITEIKEKFIMHDRVLVNIEYQVTEKIPTLFDAFSYNQDKHKSYEDSLSNLDSKLFDHDIRISALENSHKSKLV